MTGYNILMVDDDVDDIFIFGEVLKETAPTALFSYHTDSRQALETLQSLEAILPELIILDINMPILDGKEFLRLLKDDERLRSIPVAVYSTTSSDEEKKSVLSLGGFAMITKPNSLDEIREVQLHLLAETTKLRSANS